MLRLARLSEVKPTQAPESFGRWPCRSASPLIASGYAYLALSQPLAWTAYISGTLLLLWVTGLGIAQTYGVPSSFEPAPR
jgi:hypothetical protein